MRERVLTYLAEAARQTARRPAVRSHNPATRRRRPAQRSPRSSGGCSKAPPDSTSAPSIPSAPRSPARCPSSPAAEAGSPPLEDADVLYREAARRTLMLLGGSGPCNSTPPSATLLLHRDGNLGDCERLIATMLEGPRPVGRARPARRHRADRRLPRPRRPAHGWSVPSSSGHLPRPHQRSITPCQPICCASSPRWPDAWVICPATKATPNPPSHLRRHAAGPETTAEYLDHWRALLHLLVKAGKASRSRHTV